MPKRAKYSEINKLMSTVATLCDGSLDTLNTECKQLIDWLKEMQMSKDGAFRSQFKNEKQAIRHYEKIYRNGRRVALAATRRVLCCLKRLPKDFEE